MERDTKTVKNILTFFLAVLLTYLVSEMADLLIPLALALFASILVQPVLAWFQNRHVPFVLSLTAITLAVLSSFTLIGVLIYRTAKNLVLQKDTLLAQVSVKLQVLLRDVNAAFGLEIDASEILKILVDTVSGDRIIRYSGSLAGSLGDFMTAFFLTLLYFVGFVGGIMQYEKYLKYLSKTGEHSDKMITAFEEVKNSVVTYIKIKFIMSLLTGIGYWIICKIFGLDFALFWGFIAFIFNFIPTVGSVIATVPPLLLGLVQFDSFGGAIFLAVLLLAVQNILGNIIEPKLTGKSLSLNTVTVILGLVFWGNLWGITGMILSVPLLVFMKVTLAQIPDAGFFVRLMGNANELEEDGKE